MNDPHAPLDASSARPSVYSLALNALPLLLLVAGAAIVAQIDGWAVRSIVALAWLYLLPPLAVRIVRAFAGTCEGVGLDQSSRTYKVWWFETQMQVVFNRLPVLEEALRLVPGLYALWLSCWGSRVSTKVYWAAGALVTDRGLLEIGESVVIGTRAVLAPHLAYKNERGEFQVTVARIRIEDEVLVGAYAGIGPGCRIESGAEVPAAAFLRPFTEWRRDRHARTDRPRIQA